MQDDSNPSKGEREIQRNKGMCQGLYRCKGKAVRLQRDCRVWAGLEQRSTHMWFYPGPVLLMLSNTVF